MNRSSGQMNRSFDQNEPFSGTRMRRDGGS
jgi:hypothetical protein